MAKKLAAECFGTFALVFAGTGAIVIDEVTGGSVSHVGIALTFGLIVLAMVYTWETFLARILIQRSQLAFGGAPIRCAQGFALYCEPMRRRLPGKRSLALAFSS